MIEALITQVISVRPLGDNLSVVRVENTNNEIVANRTPDGSFRWAVGEPVVYIGENIIVPDDVLRERGYWDHEKDRGLLEGKKHNRVKMRRFGPEDDRVESRGLLFKTEDGADSGTFLVLRGDDRLESGLGSNVADFLGLTEHKP